VLVRFGHVVRLVQNANTAVTIIEIGPFRNGWEVLRASVWSLFLSQEQAIDYAKARVCFRSGEIRRPDAVGYAAARVLAFAASTPGAAKNPEKIVAFYFLLG
jgi:hypothetical protein